MTDEPKGCARVTGAALGDPSPAKAPDASDEHTERQGGTHDRTCRTEGPGFQRPRLLPGRLRERSVLRPFGKWILLCFYPGDFTFV